MNAMIRGILGEVARRGGRATAAGLGDRGQQLGHALQLLLALALLCHHGLDRARWPAAARETLGGS